MGGKKGGRPRTKVSDEQRIRARELLGRTLHKSKVAAALMKEFDCGRPAAYAMIRAAVDDFKEELAGRGEVDALTLAYAGLMDVAGGEKTRERDRCAALSALVKLLGLKLVKDIGGENDIEDFLVEVQRRANANPLPLQLATGATP